MPPLVPPYLSLIKYNLSAYKYRESWHDFPYDTGFVKAGKIPLNMLIKQVRHATIIREEMRTKTITFKLFSLQSLTPPPQYVLEAL